MNLMNSPIQVTKGIYRGPAPRSYDWMMDNLVPYGIKAVLNLQVGVKEIFDRSANDELKWCETLGIHLYDMTLDGFRAPRDEDVRLAMGIIINRADPIYIHCRHGKDRTGFIVAVFRMLAQGMDFELAWDEAKHIGMHWPYPWLWKSAAKSWELVQR